MVGRRLQLQERIGQDIADIMAEITGSEDVAVVLEGYHSCVSARGIKKNNTRTMTVELRGSFKDNVIALSVSYGQKHDKEIQAAKAVSAFYGVEQLFLDLSKIFQYSNCSLLQQSTEEIPEESYAKQIEKTEGEKPVSTYVPFRNGLFLSSAASIALMML